MVLRFPLLLLTVLHTVMPSIDFDACDDHSMCVVHKDCLTVSSGAGDWRVYTNASLNNPCSKAVAITSLNASEWEVAMQGMRKLDAVVDCTAGTVTAINTQIIARPRKPLPGSPDRPSQQTSCRMHVKTQDGTSLSKLLRTSMFIVDSARTDVQYDRVDKTSCHLIEALLDNECRETESCAAPILELKGDIERWICDPPFEMRISMSPYTDWKSVESVQCKEGVASSGTANTATTLTDATRIACKSNYSDLCDADMLTSDRGPLKRVSSSPVELQCESGYVINTANWTTRNLTCSAMSDLDYPRWETDRGRPVTVESVNCIREGACSMQHIAVECGGDSGRDCPDKHCSGGNVTTVWTTHLTGSIQPFGLEVDGLTCDTSGVWLARPIYGDGPNRRIRVKSGDKVSCRERLQQSAARSSVQLLHDQICSMAVLALFLLTLLMCPLMLYTRAYCVVTRYLDGRNRVHHAQINVGSNTMDNLSDPHMKDFTLQSRYTEPPKETFGEWFCRFCKSLFGKRDRDRSTRQFTVMKSDEEDEKEKLLTARAAGSAVDPISSAPPKDSGPEQSADPSTAPSQEPTTTPCNEEAQAPSSLSKKLTSESSTKKDKKETDKESEQPSAANNLTSSNSGGLKPAASSSN